MRPVSALILGLVLIAEQPALANGLAFPEQVVQFDFVEKRGTLRDGSGFSVIAKKRPFAGTNDSLAGTDFLSGDGDPPRFILERLELAIDGEKIALPDEAWSDLSDPDLPGGIRVNQGDEAMVVHVIGGDGAGSYRVSMLIIDGRLVARRIEQHGRPPRIERYAGAEASRGRRSSGWHVLVRSELDPSACRPEAELLNAISADFAGDGTIDRAVLAVPQEDLPEAGASRDEPSRVSIVVFLGQETAGREMKLETLSTHLPASFGLSVRNPGPVPGREGELLDLELPGIVRTYCEKSEVLFHWKDGRFESLALAD